MSSTQLHEVCGLRPDAGAGGIFEGFAHDRGHFFHVPLHARACGLRSGSKSALGSTSTCAKLVMAAEAIVDKVMTLAKWALETAARYLTIILYRHEVS